MKFVNLKTISCAVAAASLLMACEPEKTTPKSTSTNFATPSQGVQKSTKAVASVVAQSLDSMINAAEAMQPMLEQYSYSGTVTVENNAPLTPVMVEPAYRKALQQTAKLVEENPSMSATDIEMAMQGILDIDAAVSSGNTVTVPLNSDLCTSEYDNSVDQSCLTVLNKVKIAMTVSSDTAGSVTLKYGSFSPITMDYSANSLAYTVNLADIKGAITALATDTGEELNMEFPAVFSGKAKWMMQNFGTNHIKMSASVPQSIQIGDATNSISVAQTNNFGSIEIEDEKVTVLADINPITGSVEFEFTENEYRYDCSDEVCVESIIPITHSELIALSFPATDVNVVIDGVANTITVTNTGTLGEVSISNTKSSDIDETREYLFTAALAPFSGVLTLIEDQESLVLSSAFEFSYSINDQEDYDYESVYNPATNVETSTEIETDYELTVNATASSDFTFMNSADGAVITQGSASATESKTNQTQCVYTTVYDYNDWQNSYTESCQNIADETSTKTYTVGQTLD